MTSADLSADHRPIAKTPKLSTDGKNYNKVVIIYFLLADETELKSGILSADKSADHRGFNIGQYSVHSEQSTADT